MSLRINCELGAQKPKNIFFLKLFVFNYEQFNEWVRENFSLPPQWLSVHAASLRLYATPPHKYGQALGRKLQPSSNETARWWNEIQGKDVSHQQEEGEIQAQH